MNDYQENGGTGKQIHKNKGVCLFSSKLQFESVLSEDWRWTSAGTTVESTVRLLLCFHIYLDVFSVWQEIV